MPLGNGLQVKGKGIAFRDQMALLDGNSRMVAVCLRKFELTSQTFKVHVPNPVYPNQAPSGQDYNGVKLYTYCEVKRVPFSVSQQAFMVGSNVATYTITRSGSWWPKKRVVKKGTLPAALMEGGTFEGVRGNFYLITISQKLTHAS